MPIKNKKMVIYVSSFDDYSDVWFPFFQCFFKYWNDCPYQVYLGSVRKKFDHSQVKMLHSNAHSNWSSRAIEHLSQIKSTYVLLMLEDYMLSKKVNTEEIASLLELMDTYDLNFLRLYPDPPPSRGMSGQPYIGFQDIGQLNRTNTQVAIWRREALLDLTRPGESLWEFEINSSIRSNNRYPGSICGVWKPAIHYYMAIGKGKWFRSALRKLAKEGIFPNLSLRAAETPYMEVKSFILKWLGKPVRAILPLHIRQQLKHFFSF